MSATLQPPLLGSESAWLQRVLESPTQIGMVTCLQELVKSNDSPVDKTLTALELVASSWDWSRFGLAPELRAYAAAVGMNEPSEREAINRLSNELVQRLYAATSNRELPRHYLDDLGWRLWKTWLGEYQLPDVPETTKYSQRHLALLPMLFGHRILAAQLYVWPDKHLKEVDMELGLRLDRGGLPEPVIFGGECCYPTVRFEALEGFHRGEGEYDRRRWTYRGISDILDATDYGGSKPFRANDPPRWAGNRLLDIPADSDYGYVLGNALADVQALFFEEEYIGFQLRFQHGPDLWCIETGDQAVITIGDSPVLSWLPPDYSGIWCSEYRPP